MEHATPDLFQDSSNQSPFKKFATSEVLPFADQHDQSEQISEVIIKKLAQEGYLGATVSKEYSGLGMDWLTFGLLNFELAKSCTAVRSLITVQSMVTQVIEKWGSDAQKDQWLTSLAAGKIIAGFALTEPERGSDAAGIQTSITQQDGAYIVTGSKK